MDLVAATAGIGFVCDVCDTYRQKDVPACPRCGITTGDAGDASSQRSNSHGGEPRVFSEERMEQARNYVCHQCSTPVPVGHKFCGRCGAPIPEHVLNLRTEFFGPIQAAGSARLTLIRGENVIEGLTYSLSNSEHFAGRVDGNILFPNDAWMSPRHASFFYSDGKLFVRDENSVNGIFVRIKQPVHLQPGDQFLCGEEVFELAATPKDDSGPDEDQTYFYASPKRPSPFRVVQILRGGAPGMVYCARENSIQIGRDESDMNFPDDVYMSANHAKVELSSDGKFLLIDNGSKNGTYIRVAQQAELHHGDYVFLGKQLLRVEIAA